MECNNDQIIKEGDVQFSGERDNKGFKRMVVQILTGGDHPKYYECDVFKDLPLPNVGDIVRIKMWVNGSKALWQERAFTNLSLVDIEVIEANKDAPARSEPQGPQTGDDPEDLPF